MHIPEHSNIVAPILVHMWGGAPERVPVGAQQDVGQVAGGARAAGSLQVSAQRAQRAQLPRQPRLLRQRARLQHEPAHAP